NKSIDVELNIFKVDEYVVPIANNPATFRITKMLPGGNNVFLGDMQTDINGTIEINDLLIEVGEDVIFRIEETKAPDGYIGLNEHFYVRLVTGFCDMEGRFVVTGVYTRRPNEVTFVSIGLDPRAIPSVYVSQSGPNLIRIFVENEEDESAGRFDLEIVKTDIYRAAITNNPATFEVTRIMPGDTPNVFMGEFITNASGRITIPNIQINYAGQELIFRIEETEAPTGFAIAYEYFYIKVRTELVGTQVVVAQVYRRASNDQDFLLPIDKDASPVTVTREPNRVEVRVQNARIRDIEFNMEILKVDAEGNLVTNNSATFEITKMISGGTPIEHATNAEGKILLPVALQTPLNPLAPSNNTLMLRIEETGAPNGFDGLEEHFYILVTFGLHPDNVLRPNFVLTRTPSGVATVIPNNNIPGVEVTLLGAQNTLRIVVENEEAEEVDPAFALRLRQFISEIYTDGTTVAPANREPVVELRNGALRYDHDKTPILVGNGSTVIHTVRVFNEGDMAGFAGQIVGDLPEGVEFLPNHATNQRYEWVMYDANGNVTTDLASAVEIRTRFLSYERNGQGGRDSLINPFDSNQPVGQMNPHFRDIQIAFRVLETSLENPLNRVIRSLMKVTLNQNEEGERVQARPVADYYQDVEFIELKYFDLELTKWVSRTTVTIDGRTTTITHQMPSDDPGSDYVVAIAPIRGNQIRNAVVDVEYTIRIANRGSIAGSATEITDMIPAQMRLLPEHATNQTYGWEQASNGAITAVLVDSIIEPGEYEYIRIVTRWVNEDRNMGLIRNVGVITDTDNELGMLDINRENDSDDAVILIQPPTGGVQFYMHIIGILVVSLGIILLLIKKYILR
ncbi:MAG: prealbumin-like fold domain-containing protein, partial [Oscillospiraceae bacterium]|nr:prealbumin-like fold domain-containing protein [Oscillospiraceae bacterium]